MRVEGRLVPKQLTDENIKSGASEDRQVEGEEMPVVDGLVVHGRVVAVENVVKAGFEIGLENQLRRERPGIAGARVDDRELLAEALDFGLQALDPIPERPDDELEHRIVRASIFECQIKHDGGG
jgi:hypothetical protein